MIENIIVIGIILLILGSAVWYIIRQKKKSAKCIGCPASKTCGKQCNGCSGNCGNR